MLGEEKLVDNQSNSRGRWAWLNRTVLGIVAATFFSDFSHELATAVLPLYLAAIGLGPMALGLMEAVADFLVSLSKLGGGVLGHYVRRKQPWAALGYLLTGIATACLGWVRELGGLVFFRSVAWIARGMRGPLRDYLLADAVPATHYARAYGLERAGDMLGAVAGPLAAAGLLAVAIPLPAILWMTLLPALLATGAMVFLVQEKSDPGLDPPVSNHQPPESPTSCHQPASRPSAPKATFAPQFWCFLIGVGLFGLGDFSRTFLIWLAAHALGQEGGNPWGISLAVLLYSWHNLVSAGAALLVGTWADRWSKFWVLLLGYGLGVATNLLLMMHGRAIGGLTLAISLSGIYIAAEETLEKAVAAELLGRPVRSLGFGWLACVNAVGDLVSSLYVGWMLEKGLFGWAFGAAAAVGAVGIGWLVIFRKMFLKP